jgi:dynein heavy chain
VGKTQLVKGKLASLPEEMMSLSMSFNYFTDVVSFQKVPWGLRGGRGALLAAGLESALTAALCVTTIVCVTTANTHPTQVLEAPLEKKAGINYGPPGTKHLVYFVDDLNMPKLDAFETAMPISLIRQHITWGHWFGEQCVLHRCTRPAGGRGLPSCHHAPSRTHTHTHTHTHTSLTLLCCSPPNADRHKLTPKNINNTQYVACMNPTAGSFVVNPRLQRLFMTLAVDFPGQDSLMKIYGTCLQVCALRGWCTPRDRTSQVD